MVVVMVMAAAGAAFAVFMMVMLMIVIIVVIVIVIIVVMVMVMLMLIFIVVIIVIMVMVVMVMLVFILIIVIVIMVVMMVMFVLILVVIIVIIQRGEPDGLAVLDHVQHEVRVHLIPGSGDDAGIRMGFGDQLAALFHPVRIQQLGAAEDDRGSALHLVQEELAEVLHIHAALAGVHHGGTSAGLNIRVALFRFFHRGENLAQLADAGGLHQDAVRMIGVDQLVHSGLEVTRQGAADAAGVQLRHRDAGVLHEAAVNADFTVFVLKQHNLFILQAAAQQFFDQCCLTGSEEAGDHVYFYHG